MRNDSEILPVINVKSYPLSLPLTREGKVGGYIYIMVVAAFFVVVGCDHPARVDIGALVEELRALDADGSVDVDEIADEILVDEDLSAEDSEVEDTDSTDVSDSADAEILPDTDAVEQEPDVDAVEAEVEDDVPDLSEVEGVPDVDTNECVTGDWKTETGVVSECVGGHWTVRRVTKQWGRTTGLYYGTAVVLDSNGNIFVAGTASGTIDSSTTTGPIFLTKWNADLVEEWTKQWGSGVEAWSHGAAVDSSGNIYVTGTARGNFDGNTQIGGDDIFITRWNANGTKAWSKLLGTTSTSAMYEEGYPIVINTSDEIFTSGDVGASIDGGTYIGNYDVFLAKHLNSSSEQWVKQYGTADSEITNAMALDTSGNLYLVGSTNGSFSGYTNAGYDDLFLIKTDSAGTEVWHRQWGTNNVDSAWGVAVDDNGNIYVTGTTAGGLDGNSSAGNSDIFLTRWNADGTREWTKQWGTDQSDIGSAVTVDKDGFIFVTGAANGPLDGNAEIGLGDVFLTKWASDGTKLWTQQWGSSEGEDWGRAIAIDDNGKIFITGSAGGAIDENPDPGSTDIFLSVFSAE